MYRDVLIASFFINVFGLATPFYILNVYDKVIGNAAYETLWVMTSGIMIIYLFDLVMRGLRAFFIDEAGKKANLIISASLFERVLGLRMEVRPKSVGAFSKNLQQFDSIRDFITSFSITKSKKYISILILQLLIATFLHENSHQFQLCLTW